jgi:cytochrome c
MRLPKAARLAFGLTVLLAAGSCHAEASSALLQRYKCTVCHAQDEARTGPALVDIAAKYRGDATAPARLAREVASGTHGRGPWPMPPHPEVSAADARTMVRYILSLKK